MKKLSFVLAILFFAAGIQLFAQGIQQKDALELYHNGKYQESVQVCEEELKNDPNRIESYVVMCWSLVKNKQYAEAEQRAIEGLALSSSSQTCTDSAYFPL